MALVNCSECNTKISSEAKNCPKCGAPVDLGKIKTKKDQASKGCLIFFVIVVVIIILANTCNKSGSENINTTSETLYSEPIIDTVEEKKENTYYKIFNDLELFKKEFNQFLNNEMNSNLSIGNLKIVEGEVSNSCTTELNSRIGFLFQLNKEDNSIRSIVMIGQGDGSRKSGLNIILTMGGLIATIDQTLTPSERGDILKDLELLGDDVDYSNLDGNTIKNGIKYFVSSSDEIGIMFGAQNADE